MRKKMEKIITEERKAQATFVSDFVPDCCLGVHQDVTFTFPLTQEWMSVDKEYWGVCYPIWIRATITYPSAQIYPSDFDPELGRAEYTIQQYKEQKYETREASYAEFLAESSGESQKAIRQSFWNP
jgi:hypothetical protein